LSDIDNRNTSKHFIRYDG